MNDTKVPLAGPIRFRADCVLTHEVADTIHAALLTGP